MRDSARCGKCNQIVSFQVVDGVALVPRHGPGLACPLGGRSLPWEGPADRDRLATEAMRARYAAEAQARLRREEARQEEARQEEARRDGGRPRSSAALMAVAALGACAPAVNMPRDNGSRRPPARTRFPRPR